ncbi:hypothetical protein JST97_34105 [bacterium]|nr:hypothetical protein [bacterium]
MRQHELDILRYLLKMPGERAAQLILLSALTLRPAPDVNTLVESLLQLKHQSHQDQWSSSTARVNLFLRQRLDWELSDCERLIDPNRQPDPADLQSASPALLHPWQKTARLADWESDSQAPPWHDLSQPARLKLMRVFLGLVQFPLDTPYEPEPAGDYWSVRFLATILVGSSLLERGLRQPERLAGLFLARPNLTAAEQQELSEIVTAAGAAERMHSDFQVQFRESWLN